jgi:hypothetical protein
MKIGYGLSPDGMATWKYRIIDETVSGKYVVKAIDHSNWGLMLIEKDKLTDIKEEVEDGEFK